jgi:DNA-binding CsgD family transcriptional regulator
MADTALRALLEREGELQAAATALEQARSGEGGVLVFHGPAGIGKTRLLDEVRERADEDEMRVLTARASQLETGFPLGVARQLCEPAIAGLSDTDTEELLGGAAGLARPLLGLPGGADETSQAEDPAFAAMHGLYWLLANLSERAPLALLVDDAHWADPDSLRFLAYLASRIDGLPILIAVTVRTAEPGTEYELLDELLGSPEAVVVEPAPLSESAVAELAETLLGAEVAPEFARACHEASGGNPFYCEELLAAARADGVTPDAEAASFVAEIGPQTVGRAVLVRLARLPEACARLARALAILGDRAELRHVAALAELEADEAARCADALAEVQLLRRERPLDFQHPIVRTAIYRSMGPLERAEMHSRAARILVEAGAAGEDVALHLLEIEPSGDARVVELLRESAAAAAEHGALHIAATHLERALAEPPSSEALAEIQLELGLVLVRTGVPEAPDVITRAVELAAGRDQLREMALRGIRSLGRGSQAGAVTVGRLGLEGGEDPDDPVFQRLAAELIFNASLFADTAELARELLQRHVDAPSPGSGPEALMMIDRAWAITLDGGRAEDARSLAERALRSGALAGESDSLLPSMSAAVLVLNEGFELAAQLCDFGIEEAQSRGWPSPLAYAQWLRSNIEFRRGNLAEAGADASASAEFTRERNTDTATPWPVAVLSDVLVEQGQIEEADRQHASCNLTVELPEFTWGLLLESRGRLRLAQGRLEEAVGELREAGRRWESIGMRNPAAARWRADAALALSRLGRDEEAREFAEEQVKVARGAQNSQALGIALRARGIVSDGVEAVELLGEAAEALADSDAELEHAHAAVELGSALRRAGDKAKAREPLNVGLSKARSCGATPLAERAFEELQATGARPRKLLRGGVESLTPSEGRVARMAADGLQNKEIAQTLFVTVRTVETHLRHVYQKLDIGSREQLAGTLVRGDEEVQAPV